MRDAIGPSGSFPIKLLVPLGYALFVAGAGFLSFDPLGESYGLRIGLLLLSAYIAFAGGILLAESPALLNSAGAGLPFTALFAFQLAIAGTAAATGAATVALGALLLAALGLWAFLLPCIAQVRVRRHPGPYLAFTALHFPIIGLACALAARAGLMPWETGASLLRSAILAFATLLPVAYLRWEGGTGLRKSFPPFPGSMMPGIAILCVILVLDQTGQVQPENPWWSRVAHALLLAWIGWYLRAPARIATLHAAVPGAGAWMRSILILMMAALALSLRDPAASRISLEALQVMGAFLIAAPMALLSAYARLPFRERKAARAIGIVAGCEILAALAFRLAAGYDDALRAGLLAAAAVTAAGPLTVWICLYLPPSIPAGIAGMAQGFAPHAWGKALSRIRTLDMPDRPPMGRGMA